MSEENDSKPEKKKGSGKKAHTEEFPIQEYKLVPAGDYHTDFEEDEIDLIELAKTIWDNRKTIYKFVAVGAVLGVLVALFSPKEYKASATLMPEVQGEAASGGLSSALQKYGGLLGIGGAGLQSGNSSSISVLLYPDIVNSLPFQIGMMEKELYYSEYDTTASVYAYFKDIRLLSGMELIKKYSIGLPGFISGLLRGSGEDISSRPESSEIIRLSRDQVKYIEEQRGRVNASVNEDNGIVTVSVQMPDPEMSAELTRYAIEELTFYVTEYRIEKAQQNLAFIEEQMMEAESRYRDAQNEVALFLDQNQGQLTNRAQTELERIQSARTLAENVYNTLSQQYEEAKITVQESKPVFKVLQPVRVPVDDETSGAMILIFFVILSGMISIGWIFFREILKKDLLMSNNVQ